MDSNSSHLGVSSHVQHTPSGKPYIALALPTTSSTTPIYLTEFYRTDASAVQAVLAIPEVSANLVSIPHPYTIADAEWWVDRQMKAHCNLPLQVLRAGDPETGTFIGSVSLMPWNSEARTDVSDGVPVGAGLGEGECELGYHLHPEWRGRGIMGTAVKALLGWGREEMGVRVVVVRVEEGNVASRKVVEVGLKDLFVREEERDHWIDWPEIKGGGRRKLVVWKWTA